jgi:hypothetical protein
MRQALHIFRKDLRQAWPLVLLWTGVIVLAAADMWRDPLDGEFRGAVHNTRSLLLTLAAVIAAAMVVQLDPLVGRREFWMTRPIRPWPLFAAKAAVIGMFLAAPPLLIQMAALVRFGLPREHWLPYFLDSAVPWLGWLAFGALLGSWTKGMPTFFALLFGLLLGPQMLASLIGEFVGHEAGASIPASSLREIGLLAGLLLVFQYRTRRRALGALLGVAAMPMLWMWDIPLVVNLDSSKLATELGERRIDLSPGPGRETFVAFSVATNRVVSTELWVVPSSVDPAPGSLIQIQGVDGSIEWADGDRSQVRLRDGWHAPGEVNGLRWASGAAPTPSAQRLVLKDDAPLESLLGRSGILQAEGGGLVWNSVDSRSMPLRVGEEVSRHGFRALIEAVESSPQPFRVVVRRREVPLIGNVQVHLEPRLFLINRSRGEALPLRQEFLNGSGGVTGFMVMGMLIAAREEAWMPFAGGDLPDQEWLAGAEALVVFYELAGTLDVHIESRPIQVDETAETDPKPLRTGL